MDAGFRIRSNNKNNCPQHIMRQIVVCAFHFYNDVVLHHIQKYRRAITTEMIWLICEQPEKLRAKLCVLRFR